VVEKNPISHGSLLFCEWLWLSGQNGDHRFPRDAEANGQRSGCLKVSDGTHHGRARERLGVRQDPLVNGRFGNTRGRKQEFFWEVKAVNGG
jgi:hypothetical protein